MIAYLHTKFTIFIKITYKYKNSIKYKNINKDIKIGFHNFDRYLLAILIYHKNILFLILL